MISDFQNNFGLNMCIMFKDMLVQRTIKGTANRFTAQLSAMVVD
jgi:hypothetical protein